MPTHKSLERPAVLPPVIKHARPKNGPNRYDFPIFQPFDGGLVGIDKILMYVPTPVIPGVSTSRCRTCPLDGTTACWGAKLF
jgi:hypothetical protein